MATPSSSRATSRVARSGARPDSAEKTTYPMQTAYMVRRPSLSQADFARTAPMTEPAPTADVTVSCMWVLRPKSRFRESRAPASAPVSYP